MTRILVTGGRGFLGSHLVERLEQDDHEVFVARRRDYDLTEMADTARLFDDARPELVFHLAAEVGGIGANRANPGRYWYANLMMGAHVLEQARLRGTTKLVHGRHRLLVSRSSRPCPSARTSSGTATRRRRTRPTAWRRRRCSSGAQAYREQYGSNTIFLLPTNLYGPRDNFDLADLTRDPGADPEDAREPERGRRSGATARRLASSSTSKTASRGFCSRPSATTGPSR